MFRLVALLLALLLPLQLSWAAVGQYCQHEAAPVAGRHFGHHAHEHQASQADTKKAAGKLAFDSDCGFCHAGAPATLAPSAPRMPGVALRGALVAPAHLDPPSVPGRAPDRPQWLRLA